MPDVRFDALAGRTVIAAPQRAARPRTALGDEPGATTGGVSAGDCPFEAGHESETPPEVARVGAGAADGPGWRVRAVPNKYPIVGDGVGGAHEVVVLSPDHDRDLARLDGAQARAAMRLLRDRAAFHLARGLVHAQAFVNHGRAAGASIAHPHAQMVALDLEPPAVAATAARQAASDHDLVEASLADARARDLVLHNAPAPCWAAWAAATPYELLSTHPDAGPDFAAAPDEHVDAVTAALQHALRRIVAHLGPVPYNVVFHRVPGGRWYARVTVRISNHAGFELGTDVLVNAVPSEVAVARLREPC